MERGNEMVEIGRHISSFSYGDRKHEWDIDNTIVIDWIDFKNRVIHEVKKSPRLERAHIWQVKYYLYYLREKGLHGFKGIINYPKYRRSVDVVLADADIPELISIIEGINELRCCGSVPPPVKLPYCSRCAYYEFCWV